MRKTLIISTIVLLAYGMSITMAADKASKNKKEKTNAKATKQTLKKVPDKMQSAIELKGDESPEQMLKAYTDGITSLVPLLSTNDLPNLQKLEFTVHNASRPGAEKEHLACSQALAAIAQTDIPLESRIWLLKMMTDTGKAEVVPALAKFLDDKEERVREAARCALQNNPAQEAGEVLGSALDKADNPTWQAALALALGTRKDEGSIQAIIKIANGKDEKAAVIALNALAMIGNKESQKAIEELTARGSKEVQLSAAGAYLKCADAAELEKLYNDKFPAHIKYAALHRILESAGNKAVPRMLELMTGQDYRAREVALGQIRNLDRNGRKNLLEGIGKLPGGCQATVLESLANLGETAVLPLALDFAKNPDPEIHAAGLSALGRLGDESVVAPLCQSLVAAKDAAERAQIEQIMVSLSGGNKTDGSLIDAVTKNSGDAKRTLISALSKRNCHSAFSSLLAETENTDVLTARSAFLALGNISAPGDASVIVKKLSDITKGATRGEAENAAARTVAKIEKPSEQTAVIIPILDKTVNLDARCAVLRLLRIPGDSKALESVKAALQDKEQRIRDTAIRTLGEWPDDSAWTTLEEIYLKPEKESHRVLALRGLVRLAMGSPDNPNPRLFQRCTQLLKSTDKAEDRKLILGGLGNARTPSALKVVTPLLSDPGVKAEAGMAVKRIAEAIKKKHPKEAQAALEQLKMAK